MKKTSQKRVKRKSKQKKNDKSKSVSTNGDQEGFRDSSKSSRKSEKSSKQVHIAFLPDKYQPLVEDDTADEPPDDNSKKKQAKYKKFRKNVGKAFRYSWKCLVVGLQNLSNAYSMPLGATVNIVPDIQRAHI